VAGVDMTYTHPQVEYTLQPPYLLLLPRVLSCEKDGGKKSLREKNCGKGLEKETNMR